MSSNTELGGVKPRVVRLLGRLHLNQRWLSDVARDAGTLHNFSFVIPLVYSNPEWDRHLKLNVKLMKI